MTVSYRHTQFGVLLVGGLALGIVGMSSTLAFGTAPRAIGIVVALLSLCLLLFPTLTTEIQKDRVRCFFGFGLIRREIALCEIQSLSVVRNPWYFGWGLRLIPGGWLWNVSGLSAVELKLKNGKLFRIGTDEPETLSAALTRALKTG